MMFFSKVIIIKSLIAVSFIFQRDSKHGNTLKVLPCFEPRRFNGPSGIISKKRNNHNRSLGTQIKEQIVHFIKSYYSDYGPTLISEKLEERHQIRISKETVRKLMITNNLWKSKIGKEVKIYQRRTRRSCIGDLIQLDGSPHAWLENRGPRCTLHLAIDDATSMIMSGRFELEETTVGYFHLMKSYLENRGRPLCLYADKYGTFRVNNGKNRTKPTQFARAMKELDIGMITAHSPQAKGRIERANGILQDRLVKELREQGINTLEEANVFLPSYLEKYNKRFGKEPASSFNAHRELDLNHTLDRILCEKNSRKITKNLEVHYENEVYQIQAPKRVHRLRGASVQIIKKINGEILIEYKGELLDYIMYNEVQYQPVVVDHKQLITQWERSTAKRHKPKKGHPWKKSINF